MDRRFLITHALPISAGALAQMVVLYRDRTALGTGMLVGFAATLLTSEIVSPKVMKYALTNGWIDLGPFS